MLVLSPFLLVYFAYIPFGQEAIQELPCKKKLLAQQVQVVALVHIVHSDGQALQATSKLS
jgi:hypothetical protein